MRFKLQSIFLLCNQLNFQKGILKESKYLIKNLLLQRHFRMISSKSYILNNQAFLLH